MHNIALPPLRRYALRITRLIATVIVLASLIYTWSRITGCVPSIQSSDMAIIQNTSYGLKSRNDVYYDVTNQHESAQVRETSFEGMKTTGIDEVSTIVYPATYINWTDINPYVLDFSLLKPKEPREYFVNDHNFKYPINSFSCRHGTTFIVLVVHSAPKNFGKRNCIRHTFGSPGSFRGKNTTVVFLVGMVTNQFLQVGIERESLLYGDIVQGNFYDDYKNLSLKHVMAMDWYQRYCSSEYIIKLDDDTFVNPYRMIDYILDLNISGPTLICKTIEGVAPEWDSRSKWHTPVWQYPFPTLPQFCLGFAYITTPETWRLMYDASSKYRAMFMDDVYVSAILAMATNTRKVDFSDILLPCSKENGLNHSLLNDKAIVLDRLNLCNDIPLRIWKYIESNNKDF